MALQARSVTLGLAFGLAFHQLWVRHHLRAFSDAVERGDFNGAQRHVRRFYLSDFLAFLRLPERDESGEDGEGGHNASDA